MKARKLVALFLSIVMLLSLAACGGKAETPAEAPEETPTEAPAESGDVEPIKIGVLYPLSGGTATAGNSALWAAEWITDYINNELGGIQSLGGAKIELVVGDSKGDSEVALSEFERMVNVENVSALFGLYNTAVANTLSQYCIANQVPCQVTNAVGYDAFSVDNEYVYHANGTNQTHTPSNLGWADYQKNVLGSTLNHIAYVYDSADYGRDAYETYVASKDQYGIGEITGIPIEAGAADFSSQILKIKADPTIEWLEATMSMDDAILFMRQLKEYDLSIPLYAHGGGFLQADFMEQVGSAGDYVFCGSMSFPSIWKSAWDLELAEKVFNDYLADNGWEFDESASCAWLGFWCLWDALERAGSYDRDDIAKAMSETDISGEHYATLMSPIKAVKYEDKAEETSGLVHYNQNFSTNTVFAVLMDSEYHIIYPQNVAEPGFEMEWPMPSWDERG